MADVTAAFTGTKADAFLPGYHTVRESDSAWWGGRYRIKSPREFEQDLDLLLRIAEPVDLGQLLAWQRGSRKGLRVGFQFR